MSFRVTYRAWNTFNAEPETGDDANHTIAVVVDGSALASLPSIAEIGNGVYALDIPDADLPEGGRYIVHGSSSTANVVIFGDQGVRISSLTAEKLKLITVNTELVVQNVIPEDGVVQLFKGSSRSQAGGNPLIFDMPVGSFGDLTGFTPKIALRKLVSTTGDDTLEKDGTLENAGTADQRAVFEFATTDTDTLAVDTLPINELSQSNTGRAYEYTLDASNGSGECPTFRRGQVSVRERLSSCA